MNDSVPLTTSVALRARIGGGPSAAAAARQLVTAEVGSTVGEDGMYDLLLLTTELVTNAVQHAQVGETDTLELTVVRSPRSLRVSVLDPGGATRPQMQQPDAMTPGGMGLFLVDQLSDRWGAERNPDGATLVWFELPCKNGAGARVPVPSSPRAASRGPKFATLVAAGLL